MRGMQGGAWPQAHRVESSGLEAAVSSKEDTNAAPWPEGPGAGSVNIQHCGSAGRGVSRGYAGLGES